MAIVVAPISTVEEWCQGFKVQFPMLADADHQVSEAYGVYNLFGNELAGPAVFVVAPHSSILWSYLGAAFVDPVAADVILAQLP